MQTLTNTKANTQAIAKPRLPLYGEGGSGYTLKKKPYSTEVKERKHLKCVCSKYCCELFSEKRTIVLLH